MRKFAVRVSCVLCILLCVDHTLYCQEAPATDNSPGISGNFPDHLQNKLSGIDRQITGQSEKYLAKMARREERLAKKLKKLHPELDTMSFAYASAPPPHLNITTMPYIEHLCDYYKINLIRTTH